MTANSGIGFELAAQLLASQSNTVLLCSRSRDKGDDAVRNLKARGLAGSLDLVILDVAEEASIYAAAKHVEEKHGRLDHLVNNAGIAAPRDVSVFEGLDKSFRVHVMGPAAMVEAFAPLLQKDPDSNPRDNNTTTTTTTTTATECRTPRVINVTSGAGSIALRAASPPGTVHYRPGIGPYCVSKAAMNMLTACQAADYGPLGWKVFAFNPGFTASNLSEINRVEHGAQPTSVAAAAMVDILEGKRDGEHGGFLNVEGQEVW
ncbi:hypothetical protein BD289DRAFT_500304 [Coniella lustricola]|uniref:NAD(P)-binding protein n=1 Tax=Coniella lustricola TaxID=2025994 RepID=A0A2T3A792_9PEZI|nr:hypothetical protein BD289DRAFT_500304 [Coniella lustricola]